MITKIKEIINCKEKKFEVKCNQKILIKIYINLQYAQKGPAYNNQKFSMTLTSLKNFNNTKGTTAKY